MTKFGPIGATALSLALALATPAMARDAHHVKGATHAAMDPNAYSYDRDLRVQDALRLGYSQGYSDYPSGFSGLYGTVTTLAMSSPKTIHTSRLF